MGKNSGGIRSVKGTPESKIRDVEQGIRYGSKETGVLLNPQGDVIFRKGGKERQVSFTRDEVAKMKDNVITHNHPTSMTAKGAYRLGSPFSMDDMSLAVRADVREIRAVSPHGYTYSMKRPKGGWGTDWITVRAEYAKIKKKAKRKTDAYLKKAGWAPHNVERANLMLGHDICRMMSEKFGWIYTRIKK